MTSPTQNTGRAWEERAASFLRQNGLKMLLHGYRCRLGEIDLVAEDESHLVIVEVRARKSTSRGTALETVGNGKQNRIVKTARHLLMRNPQWSRRRIRFDVVAIDAIDSPDPEFTWVRNAFDAS